MMGKAATPVYLNKVRPASLKDLARAARDTRPPAVPYYPLHFTRLAKAAPVAESLTLNLVSLIADDAQLQNRWIERAAADGWEYEGRGPAVHPEPEASADPVAEAILCVLRYPGSMPQKSAAALLGVGVKELHQLCTKLFCVGAEDIWQTMLNSAPERRASTALRADGVPVTVVAPVGNKRRWATAGLAASTENAPEPATGNKRQRPAAEEGPALKTRPLLLTPNYGSTAQAPTGGALSVAAQLAQRSLAPVPVLNLCAPPTPPAVPSLAPAAPAVEQMVPPVAYWMGLPDGALLPLDTDFQWSISSAGASLFLPTLSNCSQAAAPSCSASSDALPPLATPVQSTPVQSAAMQQPMTPFADTTTSSDLSGLIGEWSNDEEALPLDGLDSCQLEGLGEPTDCVQQAPQHPQAWAIPDLDMPGADLDLFVLPCGEELLPEFDLCQLLA